MTEPSAEYFDDWYANLLQSPAVDRIHRRHLGLPNHVLSTSLLSAQGLAELVERLRLSSGDTLLDLACGRGGYGLEVAERVGARLIGVDFSGEAIRQAQQLAGRLGRTVRFVVGDLADTGLPDQVAQAVMCIDAIQFAVDAAAAYREMRRVLTPGGRVVLTGWEAVDRDDDRMPERLRAVDLHAGLIGAGFTEVEVQDRPHWQAAERGLWEEAAALDPGDDPALRSFHEEGVRVLEFFDLAHRVLGAATAP